MGPYVSRAFKTYTDDKLALFASTSYQMMSTDIKYDGFKMFYDEVKAKNTDFILNIAVAIPGGKDRTEDKKISRAALIWALESEAIQIERTPNVTARFITDAGFEVRNMERKSTKI